MSDLVQNARSYANSTGYMDGAGQEVRLWMHSLCDELERLTALLSQDIHSCHPNCTRSGCVNARLTRALEEARKDQARYRWLRKWVGRNEEFAALDLPALTGPESLDAAIDAAMAQEK